MREGAEGGWGAGARPPASCEREMPAAARRRGTGGGQRRAGRRGPGASGRDPWKPSDVTGPRQPARAAARFLPPPPAPATRPARRGPREPRPGPAAFGHLLPATPRTPPTGCLPGPEPVRGGSRGTCQLCLPRGAGRGGGSGGVRAGRRRTGREGQKDAGLLRGQMLWQKVGVQQGDPRTQSPLPAGKPGVPSPTTLATHFGVPVPSSLGLTLSPTRFVLEGPSLQLPRGLGVEAVGGERGSPASRGTGERLITLGSPGMPGSQRPVRCLGRGRPGPAALCPRGPPFQQQAEVWGEIVASESGLLDPKRETGAAPRGLGGASAKQTATVRGQGAFKEGSLSSPRANSTCSLPGDRLCSEEAA